MSSNASSTSNWPVISSYYKHYDLTSNQIQSYNSFVLTRLAPMLQALSFHTTTGLNVIHVSIENVYCDRPMIQRTKLYPSEARQRDLTYDTAVCADLKVTLVETTTNTVIQSAVLSKVELFRLPVMVKSCLCNDKHNRSEYNDGGYFIVNGNERVIVAQERINYNQIYVYKQKIKYKYIAEIRSVKEGADYSVLFQVKLLMDDRLMCAVPYITKDIPLYIFFVALGIPIDFILSYVKHDKPVYLFVKQNFDVFDLTQDQCITYLTQYVSSKAGDKATQYVQQILTHEILPHFNTTTDPRVKAVFVLKMISKLIYTHLGIRKEDDRDHICNKRIECTGDLLENLVHGIMKKTLKQVATQIEKKDKCTRIEDFNIVQLIERGKMTQKIFYCFKSGNWGIPNSTYIRQGVSQILSRLSYIGMISHLQRIVVPIGKESRNTQVRQIHSTNYGFIDPVETPEGQTVGIIKNFSIMTRMSESVPTTYVIDLVNCLFPQYKRTFKLFGVHHAIMINGVWIGSLKEGEMRDFIRKFKDARLLRIIPYSVSIGWNVAENEVYIYSDMGRVLRPVIRTEKMSDLARFIQTKTETELWSTLRDENVIVYIDGNEAEYSYISMNAKEYDVKSSYVEIHPSLMLGVCSNMIPFPEHSQAPRNVYVSAMMKQAIGMYSYSIPQRYDTLANVLNYPQRKLVTTQLSQICHMEEMPSGQEAIVAVMCYTGFNQEDSILMNKSAIDRGLFGSVSYHTTSTMETKKGHDNETIELPPESIRIATYNYDLINHSGLIQKGTIVKKNDVLVGRVHYSKNVPVADSSLVCGISEEGYIDQVIVTTNASGYKLVKIRICAFCTPEIGDKFCQISAQKGTIGMVFPQEDMPFTANGITPDIVINPHAFPSRMTINMLLEMVAGKAMCFTGNIQDASAFDHDGEQLIAKMGQVLHDAGYDSLGEEAMYNGFTGELIRARIFIGPAYYMRLKHLVSTKMHGRSYGNVQLLTRQPCAGRRREGGLRYGEMERDCTIVHGASEFLRERLFNLSDPYSVFICTQCFNVATAHNKCKQCKNDKTTQVHIPYACKLMFQDLGAMAMKIRIKPKQ